MNGWIVTGLLAAALVTAAVFVDSDLEILGFVLAAFVGLQVLGIVLLCTGHRRAGAWLVLVGSLAFIPIGLIGALGARRELDALAREDFEARKQFHGES